MTELSVTQMAGAAQAAALALAGLDEKTKNRALMEMADALENQCAEILRANGLDLEYAHREKVAGPLIARLALDENKVKGMAKGIRSVAALADPVGQVQGTMELDQG